MSFLLNARNTLKKYYSKNETNLLMLFETKGLSFEEIRVPDRE